ncbi:MAG: response regulator [Thermodesulfobacteriota bacterium]|nr:response regulator [Thermodesulfobacteriota bacterium]
MQLDIRRPATRPTVCRRQVGRERRTIMTKVLVVDDEEPVRRLIGQILENNGYDCTLAASAAEARERLKEQSFELVLCDMKMPGESGLDFVRYVLAEHWDTAVVMVTVVDDPSVVEVVLGIGICGYVVKPFHPRGILISVKNALHRRQLEIDNRAYRERLEEMLSERIAELRKSKEEAEQALAKLKETQAQMIHSEKMASVGQLAAGVAHEINNPAAFISSNLKALSDYQSDLSRLVKEYRKLVTGLEDVVARGECGNPLAEQVGAIRAVEAEIDIDFVLDDAENLIRETREGTERIKKIIVNLKDFAHPGEDKLQSADINKCLESTLNIVWNELKYKATVTKEYGALPLVQCYPYQLNQVFMNLLVNAAQAIEKQGEIKITTTADNAYVEIKISDTGSGIPKENLSRIFDPFFTTKEAGKGTGLGLHLAYNIIHKHNGTIGVESTVGEGTTFTIRIPVDAACG